MQLRVATSTRPARRIIQGYTTSSNYRKRRVFTEHKSTICREPGTPKLSEVMATFSGQSRECPLFGCANKSEFATS